MKFGYFDDEMKEYVITTPETPLPWINYLGNEDFFSLISNTCGGYSFYKDAKLLRLTRYRYNNVPADTNGRYYFINHNGTVWTPGWQPVKTPLDTYECRHGLGYSRFLSSKNGIRAELTAFVPLGETCEVNRLILCNDTEQEQTLSLSSYVEFCFWNAVDDSTNFQRNLSLGETEVVGSAIYHKTEYRERRNHYAYYTVNAESDGFDTDRDVFLGGYAQSGEGNAGSDRELSRTGSVSAAGIVSVAGNTSAAGAVRLCPSIYGSIENPKAVRESASYQSIASGGAVIGSHHLTVTLAPGEEKSLIFLLGYAENPAEEKWEAPDVINKTPAQNTISRLNDDQKVESALQALADYWNSLLSRFTLECGDEKLSRMVNIWNQYQCMVTFNMSRSASYFESGTGRGMGFRDSCQDLLGFVHLIPDRARQRILDIAATQFEDGSAYHQYQPLTKKGNADIGSGFNDDPLWLIAGTAAYIKETGDMSILEEQVDFLIDLFTLAKKDNVHTCIDSSGIAFKPDNKPFIEKLDRLMKLTDLVMLDIKHIDPEKHKELTSQPNDGILAFASYLNERGVDMWIRHVVVPGITDDEKYLFELGYFIGQFSNLKALDVLPYHTMGETKYQKLGIPYKLKGIPAMEKDKVIEKKEIILNGIRKRREE